MRDALRAVLIALAFLGAHTAHAALFDDDEARKRIAATNTRLDQLQKDLETRLSALEQQAKNQGLDLLRDLEAVKADVAKIRGQIEVLTYELAEAQKRQRDLYVDLDSRLRKIEGGPSAAPRRRGTARAGSGAPRDASRTRRPPVRQRPPRRKPARSRRSPFPPRPRRPTSSAPTTARSTSSSAANTAPPSPASSRS